MSLQWNRFFKFPLMLFVAIPFAVIAMMAWYPTLRSRQAQRLCAQAAAGDASAQVARALSLETKAPLSPEAHESRRLMAKAAKAGHVNAQARYGAMLYLGYGGPAAPEEAMQWLKKAVKAGDTAGYLNLASAYDQARGVEHDPARAFALYVKASDRGNLEARARLAHMKLWSGTKHRDFGLQTLERTARQGNSLAMYEFAVAKACGCFGRPDMLAAGEWMQKAADHGNRRAKELLPYLRPYRFTKFDVDGYAARMIM